MLKIFDWIKANKLSTFLLVILALYIFNPLRFISRMTGSRMMGLSPSYDKSMAVGTDVMFDSVTTSGRGAYAPSYETAPQPDVEERMTITSSRLSLLVENVTESVEAIKKQTRSIKGYVVNESINRQPQYGDESATMVIRIPTDSVDAFKEYVRGTSVKVVSENISGSDITDQYIDIEQRINRLQRTMAKFEGILDAATDIDDILRVTREINNLQSQIDSYRGQLNYMEGSSNTSRITLNLSTDEFSLPYTPIKSWRPDVVFKTAVRAMLGTLQSLGSAGIWMMVYLPILLVGVAVVKVFFVLIHRKKQDL
jgi:hypothetical protein